MRMSEYFDLPLSVDVSHSTEVVTVDGNGEGTIIIYLEFYSEPTKDEKSKEVLRQEAVAYAVNAHDNLVKKSDNWKQIAESKDEILKGASKRIYELVEENKKLQSQYAEMFVELDLAKFRIAGLEKRLDSLQNGVGCMTHDFGIPKYARENLRILLENSNEIAHTDNGKKVG